MKPNGEIVQCPNPKCGARNRIGQHSAILRPICGRCGTSLGSQTSKHNLKRASFKPSTILILNILLLAALLAVGYGIAITPNKMKNEYLEVISRRQKQMMEMRQEQEIRAVKRKLDLELAKVDPESLRRNAVLHYQSEMDARKSYEKRYALTLREKAQLRMRELASDSTKSYHEAITAVAREASPKGADISVGKSTRGMTFILNSICLA